MRSHTREDSGLKLDRQLCWWHDGEPIDHPRIVEAFNQGLKPAGDGRFRLELGADWCWVEVEEAAYAVTAVDMLGPGALAVRLSDRTAELLDASTLAVGDDGALRARVKQGQATARFSRPAQAALGELVAEVDGQAGLVVDGKRVELPLEVRRAFGGQTAASGPDPAAR